MAVFSGEAGPISKLRLGGTVEPRSRKSVNLVGRCLVNRPIVGQQLELQQKVTQLLDVPH